MILSIKLRADKDSSVKDDVLALLQEYDVQSVKWDDEVTAGVTTSTTATVARENIQQTSRWQ